MKWDESGGIPHEVLRQIVEDYGINVLKESRLKGMIADLMQGNTKIKKILKCAVNDRIGDKLISLIEIEEADATIQLANIKQSFREENFFQIAISNYVIDCFSYAMGWLEELNEYKEDQEESTAKSGELSFMQYGTGEYCGSLNENKERSGFGVYKKEDGAYYSGEWKLNFQNGIGLYVDTNRNKYAGEWRFNKNTGVGVQLWSDGIKYAGEWKNGKMHGLGILYYPNGEKLQGTFQNGIIDGICNHYLRDGTIISENWSKGELIK